MVFPEEAASGTFSLTITLCDDPKQVDLHLTLWTLDLNTVTFFQGAEVLGNVALRVRLHKSPIRSMPVSMDSNQTNLDEQLKEA